MCRYIYIYRERYIYIYSYIHVHSFYLQYMYNVYCDQPMDPSHVQCASNKQLICFLFPARWPLPSAPLTWEVFVSIWWCFWASVYSLFVCSIFFLTSMSCSLSLLLARTALYRLPGRHDWWWSRQLVPRSSIFSVYMCPFNNIWFLS